MGQRVFFGVLVIASGLALPLLSRRFAARRDGFNRWLYGDPAVGRRVDERIARVLVVPWVLVGVLLVVGVL